ncbi:hypothetical protein GGS24DRAFT_39135 [Hypoxylon argillaceum]|nr:hypothetical protein GGS24DRAFT_39135 [Hypoxylon argillaceum]
MVVTYVYEFVSDLSPAEICQLFYVLSAAAVLALAALPDTAKQLLTQYGARSSDATLAQAPTRGHKDTGGEPDDSNTGYLFRVISCLASVGRVPHSWFIHFYILSLSCTLFWAIQFVTHGKMLELIVKNQCAKTTSSMTLSQVVLAWFFMGLQGARRLYEYLVVLRPSSSRMWIVHWLLGNVFYLCTSVSIWVEGSRSIQCSGENCPSIEAPPSKSIIATLMFLIAWFMQYRCHRYLAGLKKYSLPEGGLFRYLVCPHYTCECLLYLSLAVMAAPEGQLYNRTLICAVLFVSVNLGVTANGTKLWYGEKFGSRVEGKWKMIPIIF